MYNLMYSSQRHSEDGCCRGQSIVFKLRHYQVRRPGFQLQFLVYQLWNLSHLSVSIL